MERQNKSTRRPEFEATKLDWSVVDGLVRQVTVREIAIAQKFAIYVLRTFLRLTEDEAFDAVTDGANDRGIDAVWVDEITRDVHLFQFKYREVEEHTQKQFPSRAVDPIISFVDELMQRRREILQSSNKVLQSRIHAIWDLIDSGPIRLHVHLASNGRKLEICSYERLHAGLRKYAAEIWQYGAADLAKAAVRKPSCKTRRRIQFEGGARLEFCSDKKRMLTGIVTLSELALLLGHPETPLQIDQSLFKDNVRGVLGSDNAVNQGIAKTLSSQDSSLFVFLNNGITIVAEQVLYQAGGNFPVEMVNPQIVNGCQTASVIHQAFVTDRSAFDQEFRPAVQLRIIESSDPKFTEAVALATNSQTRIYGRDLHAVDEIQIKIERALSHHGFRYLRKRTDTSELPRSQTIDMARLGQILLAYYKGEPEQAKTKSSEIFGELYDDVFNTDLTIERIIAVHVLSNMIEDRRQLAKLRLRSIERNRYQEEWILEGHFHVLFVLGLICDRDGVELSDLKGAALRLNEAVELVAEFARRHSNVAAYRLFRTRTTSGELEKLVAKTKQIDLGKPQFDLFAIPLHQKARTDSAPSTQPTPNRSREVVNIAGSSYA